MVDGMYTLEYTGEQQGSFIIRHPVSKRTYKAGRATTVRYLTVPAEDVQHFLWLGNFRVVMPAPALEPAPAPAAVAEVIEPVETVAEAVEEPAPTTTTTTTVKATLRAPKKS